MKRFKFNGIWKVTTEVKVKKKFVRNLNSGRLLPH
jgi:hypothetical protein